MRVYADFNNLDDDNRLRLTCMGTIQDLDRLGVQLREGLCLTFCMDDADEQGNRDDLLVDGIVEKGEDCFVGKVDWDTVKHESEVNFV